MQDLALSCVLSSQGLIHSSDWLQIHDSPVLASKVLGVSVYTAMPDNKVTFLQKQQY